MKITRVNQVLEVYNTNRIQKTEKINKTMGKDVFALSKEGKDFQVALSALSKVPDIRQEKVQEITQKLQSGNYNVSAQELADKIVESAFDQKI
ncbi:flagellar biosynthesis anti-sigma factor FlgM [Defluviitalea saccharophila]|uniref:Negative regulator of flagellin synthesis n=1 Tax=Defluviitalea saccharophila TaxID=879970 RepID=A0ABZ2Y0K7_9FIRM